MTDYHLNFHPTTTANILNQFEHTLIGQQVAYDIATNFTSVSDLLSHTTNGPHGSVTELLTGDSVSFNIHKPRVSAIAKTLAEYFGWNAS